MGDKHIVTPQQIMGPPPDIVLNKYVSIPSSVHGYSLAIQFVRDWILDTFPTDFFKTVHVGGKHVYADYREFNKMQQQIKKPALAIMPNLNTEYTRDNIDLIQGGLNLYTRRSAYYDDRFFHDRGSNIAIGIMFKELEMPFQIRMRVKSRAQQLDLLEYTKINCRIGSTQTHFIDIDCHVPYDIILAVAMDMGFELVTHEDGTYHIKDLVNFLKYLNSHSKVPFIYKMRTINGKCEFFIRIKHCYAHISCLDGISIDDGERQGSLESNFHIEFTPTVHFTVPAIFAYYSMAQHRVMNKEPGDIKALYQIVSVKPPEVNEKGWVQYLTTQWVDYNRHIDEIDFTELLENKDLQRVMEHNVSIGLSPVMFMDVKLYNGQRDIPIYLDWENFKIKVNRDLKDPISDIAIYADLGYINSTLENLDNLHESRMKTDIK